MTSFTSISPANLVRLLGAPEAPVLIDVSIDEDFDADPHFVPTAFRQPHRSIADLAPALQGRSVVVICQKGLKLSHGAAAFLRAEGIAAENLAGGNEAWREAGLPRVPASAIPPGGPGAMWVTRHRPKIDRIACPWLIRRFVDPEVRFLFVPPTEVDGVADRFSATPFDIEDCFWSHRGPLCTFDTMIAEFGLSISALERLARVVRGADTNDHELAPQSVGLLAISVGLSRAFNDDHQQLEAGMTLYDALYRWARDGFDEGHDWPAGRPA